MFSSPPRAPPQPGRARRLSLSCIRAARSHSKTMYLKVRDLRGSMKCEATQHRGISSSEAVHVVFSRFFVF